MVGSAGRGVRFQSTDIVSIPFSLFWLAFIVNSEGIITLGQAPWSFSLGAVFVLVGAYVAVGRFFLDSYIRARSLYFLTSRRALVITWWPIRRVRRINLATISEVQFTERRNGSGILTFGARTWTSCGSPRAPRFEFIDDVRAVYDQVTAIQAELGRKPT